MKQISTKSSEMKQVNQTRTPFDDKSETTIRPIEK